MILMFTCFGPDETRPLSLLQLAIGRRRRRRRRTAAEATEQLFLELDEGWILSPEEEKKLPPVSAKVE